LALPGKYDLAQTVPILSFGVVVLAQNPFWRWYTCAPGLSRSVALMIHNYLALAATALSSVVVLPQLLHTWRSRIRHEINHFALAGSLFVTGSWFLWSYRHEEPLPATASAIGFISHLVLTSRARRRPWLVLLTLPLFLVSAVAPLTFVEVLTSAAAFATLVPHLISAARCPRDVAPLRWVLEATEELLWACWAVAIAAPLIAAPSLATVPIALAIAWRAARGQRRRLSAGLRFGTSWPALAVLRTPVTGNNAKYFGSSYMYHPSPVP
jgi:hypothetical protein